MRGESHTRFEQASERSFENSGSQVKDCESRLVGMLLVNLRAEGNANELQALVLLALSEQQDVDVAFKNQAAFQPGKPVPIHRIA
jgi:hypothetical protein